MLEFFFNWGTPAYFNDALRRCMQFNMTTCRTDVLFAVLIWILPSKKLRLLQVMKLAVLCWKKAAHEEQKFLNLSVPSSIFVKKEIYVKQSRKGLLLLLLLGKWRYRKLPWFTKTKGVKFYSEVLFRGLFRISKIQYRQLYNFIFGREK